MHAYGPPRPRAHARLHDDKTSVTHSSRACLHRLRSNELEALLAQLEGFWEPAGMRLDSLGTEQDAALQLILVPRHRSGCPGAKTPRQLSLVPPEVADDGVDHSLKRVRSSDSWASENKGAQQRTRPNGTSPREVHLAASLPAAHEHNADSVLAVIPAATAM